MTEFPQLTRFLQLPICIINKSFMCHSFDFYSFAGDFRLNRMHCIWRFQRSVTRLLPKKHNSMSIANTSHWFKLNDKETDTIVCTKHWIVFMCNCVTGICSYESGWHGYGRASSTMLALLKSVDFQNAQRQNWHFPCFSEDGGSKRCVTERNHLMCCCSEVEGEFRIFSWEKNKD